MLDEEEEDEDKKAVWGRSKRQYYNADENHRQPLAMRKFQQRKRQRQRC